jgi:GNAT superfamily N-acetyltransferase
MDKNFNFLKLENKENELISTETLKTDELINLIYKGDFLPQDDRFLRVEDGGVFKYFNIRDLDLNRNEKFYPIVKIGEKIVGLSELLKDSYNENNLWIQFLSIDPKEQNKGYASKLIKEIFEFTSKNNYSLEASSYTDIGFEKLRPVFERLSKEYPNVKFINKGKLSF